MGILTFFFLLVLLLLIYNYVKDFFHPAVVTLLLWCILVLIYNVTDHELYDLSNRFYWALLLWIIPFSLSSILICKFDFAFAHCLSKKHNYCVNLLYPIMVVSLIVAIYGLYTKGLYYNGDNFFNGIRAAGVALLNGEEETFELPFYIRIPSTIASYALIVFLAMYDDKKKKIYYIIFAILLVLFFVFRSNKSVIAQLIFSLLVVHCLGRKISFKNIFIYLAGFVLLMFAAHLLRSKDSSEFDIVKFVSVYLLSPLPAFDNILNNNSLVCKVNYKETTMLFTGDIEEIAEEAILNKYEKSLQILKSDIIKVAHHGSKTSSKKELLKCIKPKIALIGVGKNNKFGHPSISTLNNLEEIGCKIFRTDDSGEICITINRRGKIVKIKEWIKSS